MDSRNPDSEYGQDESLEGLVVSEFEPAKSDFRRFVKPSLWGFGAIVTVIALSFGSYALWQHLSNGDSGNQVALNMSHDGSGSDQPSGVAGNNNGKDAPAKNEAVSKQPSSNPAVQKSTSSPSNSGGGAVGQQGSGGSGDGSGDTGGGSGGSPPPGQSNNCLARPSACGYPDGTNTGVPAGTVLTSHPGSQKITKDNQVIDGWDTGRINIYANNVVIKNTRITTSSYLGVTVYSGSVTVEDSTIIGTATATQECDVGVNGAKLVLRVNISGCEDGVHVGGSNKEVKDSYIHGLYFSSSSHNDGIQMFSSSGGMDIEHNTIIGMDSSMTRDGNSCIFLQPTSGSITGVTIDSNLVDGGGYCLYIEQSTDVTLSNNRVGRDYRYGWFSRAHNTNMPTLVGNIWDDTGEPI